MLDRTHTFMLRGVAKRIPDGKPAAPALTALIDAGFVTELPNHRYAVTPAGQRELSERPSRLTRLLKRPHRSAT